MQNYLFPADSRVFIILFQELIFQAAYDILGTPERRIHFLNRLIELVVLFAGGR